MDEFIAFKKEADKLLKSLSKRNDIQSQLLRLKIREKLVMLSPKVETVNQDETINFIGMDDEGKIIDNDNCINHNVDDDQ